MSPQRKWRKHDRWEKDFPQNLPHDCEGLFSLLDYCPRGKFENWAGNQMIKNLKFLPGTGGDSDEQQTYYRNRAIERTAFHLSYAPFVSETSVLVPVPTSKHTGDPEYSTRWEEIGSRLKSEFGITVAMPVIRAYSTEPRHLKTGHRTIEDALASLSFVGFPDDLEISERDLVIFDDVVTSGSSMAAVWKLIKDNVTPKSVTFVALTKRVSPESTSDFW